MANSDAPDNPFEAIPRPPDEAGQIERCEALVFTPWHCLADHQPLGSINRLRKAVYLASEAHRGSGKKDR